VVEHVVLDLFVRNSLEFSTSLTFHTHSITLTPNIISLLIILALFHVFTLFTIIKIIVIATYIAFAILVIVRFGIFYFPVSYLKPSVVGIATGYGLDDQGLGVRVPVG
jgi:hypothetical protein